MGAKEAGMLGPAKTHHHKPRAPPHWILPCMKERRRTANGEETYPLEAMRHWHDPCERLRAIRRQRRGLLDDNPSSG